MYRIVVITDGTEYPLLNQVLRLENPTLKEYAGNSPGYLKFKITPKHPYYDKILPLSSELFVYEDEVEIFRGRSTTTEEEFNRTHQITCESDLAYLCDSIIRPFEFQGSIVEFMTQVLKAHNGQVEARKQYLLGRVNVVDSNNYINRSNSDYSCSLDCLRDKLVKTHGGYLRTRYEDGKRYLDYLTDGGGTNDQVIRYGVNLADYSKTQDATELFTALIPTGADLEDTSSDGGSTTKTVDITSVNGGKDFIYDEDAVQRYGWIFRQYKWEDVTQPENLIKKARAYLEQSIYLSGVLKLTAVDLANVDVDIKRLKTGYWTRVISRPHGVDVLYILEERVRYFQEPGKDTVSLGGTIATLSGSTAKSQKELSAKVEQVGQVATKGVDQKINNATQLINQKLSTTTQLIDQKINNATQLISGGLGGYVVIGRSENGQPEEILILDAPTKANAKNVIRLNKNGIGFSTSGYNGVYRNAWTIDGNLIADFITSGTMYANRIKGGTLTLGGKNDADGVMKALDSGGTVVCQLDSQSLRVFGNKTTTEFNIAYGDDRWTNIRIMEDNQGSSTHLTSDSVYVFDGAGENLDGNYAAMSSFSFEVNENGETTAGLNPDEMYVAGDATVGGDLDVSGKKHRIVQTPSYGSVCLSAYEMASPMFGDVGIGRIGEDGRCYVWLDPMFEQAISGDYQIFLQGYADAVFYVSERAAEYFVVQGSPGAAFDWEIKAKQAGYEQERLDRWSRKEKRQKETLGASGAEYYQKYMEGLIR